MLKSHRCAAPRTGFSTRYFLLLAGKSEVYHDQDVEDGNSADRIASFLPRCISPEEHESARPWDRRGCESSQSRTDESRNNASQYGGTIDMYFTGHHLTVCVRLFTAQDDPETSKHDRSEKSRRLAKINHCWLIGCY